MLRTILRKAVSVLFSSKFSSCCKTWNKKVPQDLQNLNRIQINKQIKKIKERNDRDRKLDKLIAIQLKALKSFAVPKEPEIIVLYSVYTILCSVLDSTAGYFLNMFISFQEKYLFWLLIRHCVGFELYFSQRSGVFLSYVYEYGKALNELQEK